MKYIRQFAIIVVISFIGEVCHFFIPVPIPASVYGLIIMLIALQTGIVALESVKDVGHFFIEIMPLMFIPAAVGLINAWPTLRANWIPFFLIVLISTIIVMAVTGWCTQGILYLERRKKEKKL